MTSVAASAGTTCTVTEGGLLWCWGWLAGADLKPRRIGQLTDVVQVAVYRTHVCALNTKGEAWCFGGNSETVVGPARHGDPAPRKLPFPEPLKKVGVSNGRACGLGRSGKLWCYGRRRGVVAEDAPPPFRYPQLEELEAFTISKWVTCGIDSRGVLRCLDPTIRPSSTAGPVYEEPQARLIRDVVNVFAVGPNVCAVTAAGASYCFQVDNSPPPRKLAKVASLNQVRDIAMSLERTCAIHEQGEVSCWGDNTKGRLGLGGAPYRQRPPRRAIEGLKNVAQVVTGTTFTCARLRDGRVWCSHEGNRGKQTEEKYLRELSGIKQIAAGREQICALESSGQVRCMQVAGYSYFNRRIDLQLKTVVGLRNARSIAMSDWQACAALASGRVRCFDLA